MYYSRDQTTVPEFGIGIGCIVGKADEFDLCNINGGRCLGLLGGFGGMGGAMAAMNELTSAGLDMGQVQGVTQEVVGFAKEMAGEDTVNRIVGSIPGLGQFV